MTIEDLDIDSDNHCWMCGKYCGGTSYIVELFKKQNEAVEICDQCSRKLQQIHRLITVRNDRTLHPLLYMNRRLCKEIQLRRDIEDVLKRSRTRYFKERGERNPEEL